MFWSSNIYIGLLLKNRKGYLIFWIVRSARVSLYFFDSPVVCRIIIIKNKLFVENIYIFVTVYRAYLAVAIFSKNWFCSV